MTDDKIKEIYLYAILAKNNGQAKIPVYIFPFRMSDQNLAAYEVRYGNNKSLTDFWKNIKTGYDKFVTKKIEIQYSILENGDYSFK